MNKIQLLALVAIVGMYSDITASLPPQQVRVVAGVLPRLLPVIQVAVGAGIFAGARRFGTKPKNTGSELVPVQDNSGVVNQKDYSAMSPAELQDEIRKREQLIRLQDLDNALKARTQHTSTINQKKLIYG